MYPKQMGSPSRTPLPNVNFIPSCYPFPRDTGALPQTPLKNLLIRRFLRISKNFIHHLHRPHMGAVQMVNKVF